MRDRILAFRIGVVCADLGESKSIIKSGSNLIGNVLYMVISDS